MKFKILQKPSKVQARLGKIITPNGNIKTPTFVGVATNASLKGAVSSGDARDAGAQVVLSNTYHLYVRDQVLAIKKGGGLARFMGWNGPTMTDSGGYQVFSLGDRLKDGVGKFANYDRADKVIRKPRKALMKITEQGAEFRSHLNGMLMKLTPESSMTIQENIGADIIFAFDHPTSPVANIDYTREAMERTHRWAIRCLKKHSKKTGQGSEQALFGIVQGGPHQELREKSAQFIASLDFPGYGIGGSYHRINKSDRFKELDWIIPHLPNTKPRHFLGIGGIEDIIVAVFQGCDTFDCVMPTREGRHGRIYVWNPKGDIEVYFNKQQKQLISGKQIKKEIPSNFYSVANVTNKKFRYNNNLINPSDPQSPTYSYLYHLFRTNEMLGQRLATLNNLNFYFSLMRQLREFIKKN